MFYFFQAALQTMVNRTLSLDKEIEQKLRPLSGKILEIGVRRPGLEK